MEKETETLYKKVGRKYVPVWSRWYEEHNCDAMQAGTFRLTYAYSNGGGRYEYDVKPDNASFRAALMVNALAIEEKIKELAAMRPQTPKPYTKKQLAIIAKFKKDMGGMYPRWWTESSAYEIAQAALKAAMNYKP